MAEPQEVNIESEETASEVKVDLNLDDLETFGLKGDGVKVTAVVSN